MNLYDLHDDPKSLHGYEKADMEVPAVFWEKYKDNPAELKKREKYIAEYALKYARDILKGPFPAGEAAIAKDPDQAYYYSKYVLKGPFPAGKAAISKYVLKGPFPGERQPLLRMNLLQFGMQRTFFTVDSQLERRPSPQEHRHLMTML